MATGRRPPSGSDIPDLGEGPPPPKRRVTPPVGTPAAPAPQASSPSLSSPPSPASPGALDYFGSGTFDDEQFEGSGISIALETESPAGSPRGARSGGSGGGDEDLDLHEGSAKSAKIPTAVRTAVATTRKWPTGMSLDTASLRVDSVEVTVAADYGPAPESLFGTPGYAWRVQSRRRVLGVRVKELSAVLAESEEKRDELLVAMVQDLRGKLATTEAGEALFEPIVALERTALERRSALSGTNAEYDARVTDLEERQRLNDRKTEEQQAVIEQRKAALGALLQSLARAEAKKKRLYIELEGFVRISEKTAGKLSAEQQASMVRLDAEIVAQKPELDTALGAVESSRAVLAAVEADFHKVELAARELHRLRRTVDQELQKQIGTRSQGVTQVEDLRRKALADLGRKILSEKGRLIDVRGETLDQIARADQLVEAGATDLEKHVRAVDEYDADAVKKGFGVLAVAAAVVLIVIVVLVKR